MFCGDWHSSNRLFAATANFKECEMLTDEERVQLKRTFSALLALEPFLQSLRLRNCSSRTIREYRKVLENYFLDSQECGLGVSRDALTAWVAAMYERGLNPKTISTRIVALRSFFSWAVRSGLLDNSPAEVLPRVKVRQSLPKALTQEEVQKFMAAIRETPGERARRDLVVFTLLYACGLRVSEVVSLRIEDTDLEGATLQVLGKGDKERSINLREQDVDMLRKWIGKRRDGWLFLGENGHLSSRVVQIYCGQYGKAAGIRRRVHPHLLRHSCAVHFLTGGAPITFVQQRLGHASLATTGIYTQLADQERARIARGVKLAV